MQQKELPLSLGQKITVKIRGEQFEICIRGWRPFQFLVTDGPLVGSEPLRLVEQTGCVVQYIREGVFVTFNTTVVFIIASIYPVMVLEYPRKFETHNLRKTNRHKVAVPAFYTFEGNKMGVDLSGMVRDLSLTGALMSHNKQLVAKSKITLRLRLGAEDVEGVEALVQNVRHNPKNEKEPYVTGLKFIGISDDKKVAVSKFLEQIVIERQNKERVM
jgi:c-di-GMP-binding flagellar brake protein YcgR